MLCARSTVKKSMVNEIRYAVCAVHSKEVDGK